MSCPTCKKKQEEEFRKIQEEKKGNAVTRGIGMMQSYASALVSRGLDNKKVSETTKQLRVISCFGNQHLGGELPACQHLKNSETVGKHFCGGCGCGDRQATWLISEGNSYSKLDHPKLSCPLGMPGFTDYKASDNNEAVEPITRKFYIENMPYEEIQKVSVTINEKQQESE